jgi:hypothetical protein
VLGTPSWSSGGSRNSVFTFTDNLAALTALDNQAAVYFRLTEVGAIAINGSSVATTGADRVDNFTITAIPEPSTCALLLGGATSASVFFLRRRKSAQN